MATRDIKDAAQVLQDAWPNLLRAYHDQTGNELLLTCVYRSPEEQQALYALGRTAPGKIVTRVDGKVNLSKHNKKPSEAIDVAVLVAGKASWDEDLYVQIGPLARSLGLHWGGYWGQGYVPPDPRAFKDLPHIEVA